MCFSATASFVTAAAAGAMGVLTLSRTHDRQSLLLAATPLLFGAQQTVEGLLWLELPVAPVGPVSTGLTLLFLFFAQAFWPIYSPVATMLVEPDKRRRRFMMVCLVAGIGISAYMLWGIFTWPHAARILDDHIVYMSDHRASDISLLIYLAAAALPLLLSSRRTVVVLGIVIVLGAVVAYTAYWEAYVSVWCFFAAVACVVILGHFELSHRRHLQLAGA